MHGSRIDDPRKEHFAGIVQVWSREGRHNRSMKFDPWAVYSLSVIVLFLKFFVTISVQARERLRERRFRYPEDSEHWHGVRGEDSDLCQRADRLLRNDAESQLYYLALAAAYVASGAWPTGTIWYFGGFTGARLFHGYWLLTARQPHRNRAFAVGIAILFCMSGQLLWTVLRR